MMLGVGDLRQHALGFQRHSDRVLIFIVRATPRGSGKAAVAPVGTSAGDVGFGEADYQSDQSSRHYAEPEHRDATWQGVY